MEQSVQAREQSIFNKPTGKCIYKRLCVQIVAGDKLHSTHGIEMI